MFSWIADNIVTIVAILVVAALVGGAIAVIVRDKKKSRSGCGHSCCDCPMSGACHGSGK